jgi:hypothetical protein
MLLCQAEFLTINQSIMFEDKWIITAIEPAITPSYLIISVRRKDWDAINKMLVHRSSYLTVIPDWVP